MSLTRSLNRLAVAERPSASGSSLPLATLLRVDDLHPVRSNGERGVTIAVFSMRKFHHLGTLALPSTDNTNRGSLQIVVLVELSVLPCPALSIIVMKGYHMNGGAERSTRGRLPEDDGW